MNSELLTNYHLTSYQLPVFQLPFTSYWRQSNAKIPLFGILLYGFSGKARKNDH